MSPCDALQFYSLFWSSILILTPPTPQASSRKFCNFIQQEQSTSDVEAIPDQERTRSAPWVVGTKGEKHGEAPDEVEDPGPQARGRGGRTEAMATRA